jgi:hypothetical protein
MSDVAARERPFREESSQDAAEMTARQRERRAKKAQRDAERRARFGPLEVMGRDGVRVGLVVARSGWWGVGGDLGPDPEPDGGPPSLEFVFVGLVLIGLAKVFSHFVLFLGGSTLHITAPDRKKIKIRLRSKAAAAQRLHEIADAVRREGVVALDPARGHLTKS